jgi:hypothetical protein
VASTIEAQEPAKNFHATNNALVAGLSKNKTQLAQLGFI